MKKSMIFRLLIVVAVALAIAAGLRPEGQPSPANTVAVPGQGTPAPTNASQAPTPKPALAQATPRAGEPAPSLSQWLAEYRALDQAAPNPARAAALLQQGLAAAENHRAHMAQLMRENPPQALQAALRFDEYYALPAAIRARVERPFSEAISYSCLPVCGQRGGLTPAGPDQLTQLTLADGTSAEVFAYGTRAGIASKRALPASGIVLDGQAVVRDAVFYEVQAAERETVLANFSAGQKDAARSFASGKPIAGNAVLGLAGGHWYAFADRAELARLNDALLALDAKPGPDNGSALLQRPALADPVDGTFDLPGAYQLAEELASQWTETKKKVFLIRVDFSDHAGAPVTQADLSATLNGPTSDAIRAMSYGKTWTEATVSANLYRLPQTGAYYAAGVLNDELIRDARNAFRNTRSGADSAINIGPVNTSGNGGGSGLGDYDIVGVFFANVGMTGSGTLYAGLATLGGGELWLQDANDTSVCTHELGHNFGLGHASFWQTSDGSVVGTGSSVEYGDIFDVMGGGSAGPGHFHPQGKARLNWLATNQWADATATGSGTYRVYRFDDALTTNAPMGLRVTKAATAGSEEYYWVGYRAAYTGNQYLQRGAYLIWQRPGQPRSWLLDATPNSANGRIDSAVALGRTYSDTNANIHITPVAVGGSNSQQYLDVRVNLGAFAGNHAPVASAFSGPAAVVARSNYTYTVTATDADADALAYAWAGHNGSSVNSNASLASWTVGGTNTLSVTISDMKGGTTVTNKTVVVTDPLDSWSASSVTNTAGLEDVLWAKGRCVSVNYFGGAFFSWNGVDWESLGALPSFEAYTSYRPQLAFGANVFVAVGKKLSADAAQLDYSPDGRHWYEGVFPAGVPQTMDVAYGAGQFVAVGNAGAVFRSTDGINWTFATVPGAPNFSFVTFDGALWLAVANNNSGYAERLWTSLDGATWTQKDLLGMQIFDIFAIKDTVYAAGYYGGLKYSTDHGQTWQNATLPGTAQWTTRHLAAADDGTFLLTAQAMDETGSPSALLVSTDGRNWSRTTGNTNVAYTSRALAFGSGRFISVGNNGGVYQSATLYPANHAPAANFATAPTNGNVHQVVYFAASATDADGDTLTYAWDFGSDMAILDGAETAPNFSFGGTRTATLRVSDNRGALAVLTRAITVNDPARSWTQRTSGTTVNLNGIAANAATVVAVGDGAKVLTSTNGSNWTTRALPGQTGNVYLYAVGWDGSRFQAAGMDYDFNINGWVGIIFSSPDGTTWTQRYKSTVSDTALQSVASCGSTNVAVGDNGTVVRTTDGTNWSSVTVSALGTATVSGVAYGGGSFVLVAYTGGNGTPQVFTSANGLSWVDRSSGAGLLSWQDLRKVAWLNDRFVASGWYSSLRVSADLGQTFTTTRSHVEDTRALAYGNGCWLAVGMDRSAGSAVVDVMSYDGVNWSSFTAPSNNTTNGAAFFKNTFITVGASGAIWQSGALSSPNGFSAWQVVQFPNGSVLALPNRDYDGDGLINVAEYALGRDPLSGAGANGGAAKPQTLLNSGRIYLQLDLPEPSRSDVNYVVQAATNLPAISWTEIARKNGADNWQWTGPGAARLTPGATNNARTQMSIGAPDTFTGRAQTFLRFVLEAP